MSLNLSRTALARVASTLACGPILVALVACHHRTSTADELSPAERVTLANAQRPIDAQRLRSFPGIDVIRTPNGGFLIRILGGSGGNGQPLYVIDDAPTQVDPRRGIDWLPEEEISHVKVLKYPAETAVYGPQGVNGVILITTKRGARLRMRAP